MQTHSRSMAHYDDIKNSFRSSWQSWISEGPEEIAHCSSRLHENLLRCLHHHHHHLNAVFVRRLDIDRCRCMTQIPMWNCVVRREKCNEFLQAFLFDHNSSTEIRLIHVTTTIRPNSITMIHQQTFLPFTIIPFCNYHVPVQPNSIDDLINNRVSHRLMLMSANEQRGREEEKHIERNAKREREPSKQKRDSPCFSRSFSSSSAPPPPTTATTIHPRSRGKSNEDLRLDYLCRVINIIPSPNCVDCPWLCLRRSEQSSSPTSLVLTRSTIFDDCSTTNDSRTFTSHSIRTIDLSVPSSSHSNNSNIVNNICVSSATKTSRNSSTYRMFWFSPKSAFI